MVLSSENLVDVSFPNFLTFFFFFPENGYFLGGQKAKKLTVNFILEPEKDLHCNYLR